MIVPFDDLELVHQSLRTLEPPNTRKFPRVNAQDSKLGPIQPWDVEDFLRPLALRCGRKAAELPIAIGCAIPVAVGLRGRHNLRENRIWGQTMEIEG